MSATEGLFERFPNKYFIETGTCLGDGVYQAIDAGFQIIISIELSEELYDFCEREFKYYPSVILYNGDSTEILWDIIENIQEPITFWLDAHYSGNARGNKIRTADNNKPDTPVMDELKIIKKHPIKTHSILIDDMVCFLGLPVAKLLYDINKDYKINFICTGETKDILFTTLDEHESHSQVYQDRFVLSKFPDGHKGFFVDIGCQLPYFLNNTSLLEDKGWDGVSFDIADFSKEWGKRKTKFIQEDALTCDYSKYDIPKVVDYLSLDINQYKGARYDALKNILDQGYEFKVITIEHDAYDDNITTERDPQRAILTGLGYIMVAGDVEVDGNPFEDWWINPKYVKSDRIWF